MTSSKKQDILTVLENKKRQQESKSAEEFCILSNKRYEMENSLRNKITGKLSGVVNGVPVTVNFLNGSQYRGTEITDKKLLELKTVEDRQKKIKDERIKALNKKYNEIKNRILLHGVDSDLIKLIEDF